jgi:hypothetical protein
MAEHERTDGLPEQVERGEQADLGGRELQRAGFGQLLADVAGDRDLEAVEDPAGAQGGDQLDVERRPLSTGSCGGPNGAFDTVHHSAAAHRFPLASCLAALRTPPPVDGCRGTLTSHDGPERCRCVLPAAMDRFRRRVGG